MALLNTKGIEASNEIYHGIRSRAKAALALLPELREVLEVRSHKRAFGFNIGSRARLKAPQHGRA